MITGFLPWNLNRKKDIGKQILSCEVYYPSNVSPKMKELLKLILKKNPDERLSIEQIRKYMELNFDAQTMNYFPINQKIVGSDPNLKCKSYMFKILTKTSFH
jgi:serine/threonine protein kinase